MYIFPYKYFFVNYSPMDKVLFVIKQKLHRRGHHTILI